MMLSTTKKNNPAYLRKLKQQLIVTYEKYMFFIGIVGQLLFYFQAYKIFSTQSACSVSLVGFSISFISLTSWLIYGLILKNLVLTLSNIAGLIGCTLVLIGIMLY